MSSSRRFISASTFGCGALLGPIVDPLSQVLDVREVPGIVLLAVQIPGLARSASTHLETQRTLRFGAIRHSSIWVFVNPFTASTDSESDAVRSREANWLAGVSAELGVHDLRIRRAAARRCRGDRALQVPDPVDLFADVGEVEVQMLTSDEVDIVDRSLPRPT